MSSANAGTPNAYSSAYQSANEANAQALYSAAWAAGLQGNTQAYDGVSYSAYAVSVQVYRSFEHANTQTTGAALPPLAANIAEGMIPNGDSTAHGLSNVITGVNVVLYRLIQHFMLSALLQ